ncbi:hypothetical protein AVEN_275296-1 [Araneus ventricosus]|uniref:Uncharacterized protein n=1 Tax=Araneus ventricosus TaxID=182803 RepID=A0A4Y2GGF9_ARAVE|nr:hypothetical protein AVEN_275296-1 [Araneus ventricosus]
MIRRVRQNGRPNFELGVKGSKHLARQTKKQCVEHVILGKKVNHHPVITISSRPCENNWEDADFKETKMSNQRCNAASTDSTPHFTKVTLKSSSYG